MTFHRNELICRAGAAMIPQTSYFQLQMAGGEVCQTKIRLSTQGLLPAGLHEGSGEHMTA